MKELIRHKDINKLLSHNGLTTQTIPPPPIFFDDFSSSEEAPQHASSEDEEPSVPSFRK
jgi:hypothetical protein